MSVQYPPIPSSLGFEIVRLGGHIGAEIRGIDMRQPCPEQFDALNAAFVRYEVLIFREQDITLEQQMAFAKQFGPLSIHPFGPNLDDKREVIVLEYDENNPPALTDQWHSDETFRMAPPLGTMLRAKVVPAHGGDTLFASMTAAYTSLSERMKQYIHGLEAIHDFTPFRTLFTSSERHQTKLREVEREFPNPSHPLVRVHPVSGRRLINVNAQFTTKIKGLKDEESRMILQYLYSRAQIPEFQLRVKWQPNTVVLWDNRATQHYAPHDYSPQRRSHERVTIEGGLVEGVTGNYTPEQGVEPAASNNPKKSSESAKRAVREFER